MIGFYDYTVIMTYISVVSSMIGIFCAVTDHISAAVCCLAFSGLCDKDLTFLAFFGTNFF